MDISANSYIKLAHIFKFIYLITVISNVIPIFFPVPNCYLPCRMCSSWRIPIVELVFYFYSLNSEPHRVTHGDGGIRLCLRMIALYQQQAQRRFLIRRLLEKQADGCLNPYLQACSTNLPSSQSRRDWFPTGTRTMMAGKRERRHNLCTTVIGFILT